MILLFRALILLIFMCIVLYFSVFPLLCYCCSFLLDYLIILKIITLLLTFGLLSSTSFHCHSSDCLQIMV